MYKHFRYLSLVLVAAAMVACSGKTNPSAPVAEPSTASPSAEEPMVVIGGFTDTVPLEVKHVERTPEEQQQARERAQARAAAKQQTQSAAKSQTKPAAKGKGERIYVETEGAQGRVWGHVTLNGDKGTGTIHDWDENTLSVTVTRHGDELFAVDQNSRQYVFKLRK